MIERINDYAGVIAEDVSKIYYGSYFFLNHIIASKAIKPPRCKEPLSMKRKTLRENRTGIKIIDIEFKFLYSSKFFCDDIF